MTVRALLALRSTIVWPSCASSTRTIRPSGGSGLCGEACRAASFALVGCSSVAAGCIARSLGPAPEPASSTESPSPVAGTVPVDAGPVHAPAPRRGGEQPLPRRLPGPAARHRAGVVHAP
ncbi:hypothetical protein B7486_57240, partial [cyanobacterium TDX16]